MVEYNDTPSWEDGYIDKTKYNVVLDIHTDELKDIGMELASKIKSDKVLVHRVYAELGSGATEAFLSFYHQIQPALIFFGGAITSNLINDLYTNFKSTLIKLYKKIYKKQGFDLDHRWNDNLPIFIEIFGPNNSSFQFRFLSSFDEDEYLDAWKTIPVTLEKFKFTDNYSVIFLFNTRKTKWFAEGYTIFNN